ncbi:LLM class flavin-dependent oxidoreductase, partial [Mycobacterium kansasii]
APVVDGASFGDALRDTIATAQEAERLGYERVWVAEHHSMPGIASSAPAVLIGQIAAATETIRVGSGGVMLPNHQPLVVAEQFGTL